jgi:hypothetical protein
MVVGRTTRLDLGASHLSISTPGIRVFALAISQYLVSQSVSRSVSQ